MDEAEDPATERCVGATVEPRPCPGDGGAFEECVCEQGRLLCDPWTCVPGAMEAGADPRPGPPPACETDDDCVPRGCGGSLCMHRDRPKPQDDDCELNPLHDCYQGPAVCGCSRGLCNWLEPRPIFECFTKSGCQLGDAIVDPDGFNHCTCDEYGVGCTLRAL